MDGELLPHHPQTDWLTIIQRATSLHERLTDRPTHPPSDDHDDRVERRLQEWCQVAAQGNWDTFAKRLEWDGLNLETVRQVLAQSAVAIPQTLPGWCKTLQAVIDQAKKSDGLSRDRCFNPDDPIPFETILVPFIQVARQQLEAATGATYAQFADAAHASLERGLLARLAKLAAQSFQLEFVVFRDWHQMHSQAASPPNSTDAPAPNQAPTRTHYTAFVRHYQQGGLLHFFQEYSVLARLLATVTGFWVETHQALLTRLASDRTRIQSVFGGGKELGPVIVATPDLSDYHHGGQTVVALTFAAGIKLVYKPKNIGPEVVYFQLLAWLNQRTGLLPLKVLTAIPRSTYGWVEFADHLPCQDAAAVKRYYQRMGMLLCLIYAVGGTDCHRENLVACGEHPVLIDLEALLYHRVGNGRSPAPPSLWESVLRVGFLPQWEVSVDGTSYDISALAGSDGQQTSLRIPRWQQVNTDQMGFRIGHGMTANQTHLPFLHGQSLSLMDYQTDIIAGFQGLYRFLLQQQSILVSDASPLAAFATQPIRFLLRPTRVYGYISRKLLQPKFMREGIDYGIQLDVLSKALLVSESRHPFWHLLHLEEQALQYQDIPIFNAQADSHTLLLDGGTPGDCFEETAFQRMIRCLSHLSENDLTRQSGLIQASFYAYAAGKPGSGTTAGFAPAVQTMMPLSPELLKQRAIAIAEKLAQQAIVARDGSVTWAALTYVEKAQRLQLRPLGYGLYDGCSGVALFLAALAHGTGDSRFRDLCFAALQPLQSVLQIPRLRQSLQQEIGLGGAAGLGSVVYALVRISQLCNEPALLDSARLAALAMTPDAIAADQSFDVIAGAAGAILGLLALYQVTAEPAILQQATWCGQHLLKHQQVTQGGYHAWATLNQRFLAGFSHGAAGIAYALLRLYAVTGDPALRVAAEAGMAYERSIFSPQFNNWPDRRGNDDQVPAYLTAWCHGATGIGLARLGGLAILDTPAIRHEIETALTTTQVHNLQNVDHLCCGNAGKIELLWEAATRLERSQLGAIAQQHTAWVLQRASQTGTFTVFGKLPSDAFTPGFFVGTSGIGYTLLRQALPGQLPSVLLWD